MDLSPFSRINPCGYPGLRTTDMAHAGFRGSYAEAEESLIQQSDKKYRKMTEKTIRPGSIQAWFAAIRPKTWGVALARFSSVFQWHSRKPATAGCCSAF